MIALIAVAVVIAIYGYFRDNARPSATQSPDHFAKVHGIFFRNHDGTSRQAIIRRCSEGEELKFIREPDNPKDRFAIKICRLNGEQLGYWRGGDEEMARDLDSGEQCRVFVEGFYDFETDDEKPRRGRGVRIRFEFQGK